MITTADCDVVDDLYTRSINDIHLPCDAYNIYSYQGLEASGNQFDVGILESSKSSEFFGFGDISMNEAAVGKPNVGSPNGVPADPAFLWNPCLRHSASCRNQDCHGLIADLIAENKQVHVKLVILQQQLERVSRYPSTHEDVTFKTTGWPSRNQLSEVLNITRFPYSN